MRSITVRGRCTPTPSLPPIQAKESRNAMSTYRPTATSDTDRRRHSSRADSRQSGLRAAAQATTAAPATRPAVTRFETTYGSTALLQPHARVDHRVAQVGEDLSQDEEQGADEDHRAQRGEVVRVDGVHREGTEAG